MRRALLLGAVFAAAGISPASAGVTVQVEVANVHSARGHVRVAICRQQEFLKETCALRARVPAAPGTVLVRVDGVPPGTYAVQAWHDENDDGKINRNFFGLPTEGIGFSRDAPMRFGPPRFADAAVAIGAGGARLTLRLRYFT